MRDWFRNLPKFSLMGGVAAGLVVLLFAFTISRLQDVTRTNCRQVQQLQAVIRAVIQQDLQTLGQKGAPGYAYYQGHPAELASTRVALRRELVQFAPRRCQ